MLVLRINLRIHLIAIFLATHRLLMFKSNLLYDMSIVLNPQLIWRLWLLKTFLFVSGKLSFVKRRSLFLRWTFFAAQRLIFSVGFSISVCLADFNGSKPLQVWHVHWWHHICGLVLRSGGLHVIPLRVLSIVKARELSLHYLFLVVFRSHASINVLWILLGRLLNIKIF